MHRFVLVAVMTAALTGCSSLFPPLRQDPYVVFFAPGTIQLTLEGEEIVRQASANARSAGAQKIEIAIPQDTPGGVSLVEGRFTAIQNILSASGTDPRLFARGPLLNPAANIPGAANRAEIKLSR